MTYFKIVMQGQSETDVQLRLEHQSESFTDRVVGSSVRLRESPVKHVVTLRTERNQITHRIVPKPAA